MAGTLIVSNLKTDTDNSFIVRSNTGTTLFVANTTGIDVANSFASSSITSDKILTVANTKISGNIISSQISPSVTLYGNPTVTSGNLTVGGSTSLGTASASGNTTMYQAPGSSFLIMNVNGTLAGARRNWAISPESQAAGALCFECGTSEGAVPSSPRLIIKQQGAVILSGGSTSADGTGITFPASQSASSDANTLDDYEEGTYTMTWTCSNSGTITLDNSASKAYYTKIGRVVFINAYAIVSSVSSPNGYLNISLPFPSSSTLQQGARSSPWISFNNLASGNISYAWPILDGNSSSINVYTGGSTGVSANWANNIAGNVDARISVAYITNT